MIRVKTGESEVTRELVTEMTAVKVLLLVMGLRSGDMWPSGTRPTEEVNLGERSDHNAPGLEFHTEADLASWG